MHENAGFHEVYYLRSASRFIAECKKRNLRIKADFLLDCAKSGFLKPVILIDEEPYYDLFQIPLVAEILEETDHGIKSFRMVQKSLKERLACFEQMLPLLYEVRYFYFHDMYSFVTTGVLPPFEMTEEEAKKYVGNWSEMYYHYLEKYKPKEFAKKLKVKKKPVREASHDIFIKGYRIDPIPRWYPLVKTIRSVDYDKFKLLEGKALLAHDYYAQAEILFFFYQDAFGTDIIAPEDIFDGRIGQWKIKKCQKCNKETKVKNSGQKYCQFCQKTIANSKGVTFKCGKCGKPFYKYVDGDEVVDKPTRPVSKDEKHGRSSSLGEIITITRLGYGRMVVMAQCSCGRFNREIVEKGWY